MCEFKTRRPLGGLISSILFIIGACGGGSDFESLRDTQSVTQLTSQEANLSEATPFWYIDDRGVFVKSNTVLNSLSPARRYFELPPIQVSADGQLQQLEVIDLSPIVLVPTKNVRPDPSELREQDFISSPYRLASCPMLSNYNNTNRLHTTGLVSGMYSRVSYGQPFEIFIKPGGLYFASEHCFFPTDETIVADADLVDPDQLIFAAHIPPSERTEATAVWLGADIETEAVAVVSRWFYPEADYSEDEWLAGAPEQRVQRLYADVKVVADRYDDHPHPAEPSAKQLFGWKKTHEAPEYLADTMDVETQRRVEVKISTSHLFKSLTSWKATLADLNSHLHDIAVHTHLSFPRTNMIPYHARRYAALLMWANEQAFFEQLSKIKQANYTTQHRGFRPLTEGEANAFEKKLLTGGEEPAAAFTYRYVPFRTPFIYGGDRYGYEIRIYQEYNRPDFLNQEALLETMLMWIQNSEYVMYTPQGMPVSLDAFVTNDDANSEASTYVASIGAQAFEALDDVELQDFLLDVSHTVDPDQTMNPPMHWVYALPFVPWWQRDFIRDKKDLLIEEASNYRADLRLNMTMSHMMAREKVPIQMGVDLARWARKVNFTSRYHNRMFYSR
ncbi:MAG: hypothetical protein H6715_06260 [Myxococcales bacterium]|nr:hypothetical protein [Myxococcales bacterium]MCB9708075.1 hypothetical protein [Myxococcales bacterium]